MMNQVQNMPINQQPFWFVNRNVIHDIQNGRGNAQQMNMGGGQRSSFLGNM
jgi:hypothetical protein